MIARATYGNPRAAEQKPCHLSRPRARKSTPCHHKYSAQAPSRMKLHIFLPGVGELRTHTTVPCRERAPHIYARSHPSSRRQGSDAAPASRRSLRLSSATRSGTCHLLALSLFSSAARCASLALPHISSARSFNASTSTFKPSCATHRRRHRHHCRVNVAGGGSFQRQHAVGTGYHCLTHPWVH